MLFHLLRNEIIDGNRGEDISSILSSFQNSVQQQHIYNNSTFIIQFRFAADWFYKKRDFFLNCGTRVAAENFSCSHNLKRWFLCLLLLLHHLSIDKMELFEQAKKGYVVSLLIWYWVISWLELTKARWINKQTQLWPEEINRIHSQNQELFRRECGGIPKSTTIWRNRSEKRGAPGGRRRASLPRRFQTKVKNERWPNLSTKSPDWNGGYPPR